MLGYFIEVPQPRGEALLREAPHRETFIHRQTMAGAMRFTTTELGELERKIAAAGDSALGLELDISSASRCAVTEAGETSRGLRGGARARSTSRRRSRRLAVELNHVRPRVDDGLAFALEGAAPSGGRGGAEARRQALRAERR